VPAYTAVVDHGVTGLLAASPEQWARHLKDLVYDPARRVEIGDAARKAAAEWTIQRRAVLWERAYASLL
jgi:glycosyltransferase involved in cell wall biosynthesis